MNHVASTGVHRGDGTAAAHRCHGGGAATASCTATTSSVLALVRARPPCVVDTTSPLHRSAARVAARDFATPGARARQCLLPPPDVTRAPAANAPAHAPFLPLPLPSPVPRHRHMPVRLPSRLRHHGALAAWPLAGTAASAAARQCQAVPSCCGGSCRAGSSGTRCDTTACSAESLRAMPAIWDVATSADIAPGREQRLRHG